MFLMNTLHKYCEKIQLNRKFSKRVLIHGSAHIYHLFKEFATFTEGGEFIIGDYCIAFNL